ncbi:MULTISPECIES: IS256 family transposase [unclassified Breznakia]|uniref:IS256 family transposase n=1 Tax=unclassified Breznakia TaxID=2623764 RepID=UPI002476BD78|nr:MULTISPECIES: IS256 family transposase [unclassified Breznakia]MDH6368222.1 putative transposase [Breznakia sp. PH1-1]MDH6405317.1 putative transposase [Breznakia sp. PF1-11]MDH6415392.1 putative transposase [Breznakia sp. PFB1-14]MDH6420059.1 putative transposase [Breznakia sp. PFB1-12]MDH6477432.1 putative transposase [Breznakia sp. PFB1-19]
MNNFSTEIYKALSQGLSIDQIICNELQDQINYLLKTELAAFLDYDKHDVRGYNSGNSRNGFYTRDLETKYGTIKVEIPRDRNGEFNQQTIQPYARRTDDLETAILHLYSKGVTTAEIADLIDKMYGHAYSPATISNITMAVEEHVQAFHSRKLNKRYTVVYGDATMINVRRDSVSKEALHILIGITPEGTKEVLDYRLYPQESSENYKEMLEDIKQRGTLEILLFVTDGLSGLANACLSVYPKAKHQACWVHVQRSVSRNVRAKDKKEVLDDLKPVYRAKDEVEAQKHLEVFKDKYKSRYPKVIKSLSDNQSLFSFYEFPEMIRSSLYTTNLIEGMNKQLKRNTKRKEQFPNEDSLDRFVCDYMMDYNRRFSTRIHKGFGVVQAEINDMFDKRYN